MWRSRALVKSSMVDNPGGLMDHDGLPDERKLSMTADGRVHNVRFPGESAQYRQARNALLEAEIALRRQIEAVAAQRRALPPGGVVARDYVFEEGDDATPVQLSELFAGKRCLVAYSFMYGPRDERPCPSCTSILDALDRAAVSAGQRLSLVVISRSPIARIRAFARERGWSHLRLLSSAANSYNVDYHGEDAKGDQQPVLNVFTNDGGAIRHAYATEVMFAGHDPGQDPRHVDAIWPLWSVFDFTPDGRGDFHPKLSYD
jgi:predicted dithiol-disulfide oxidoreductase (DUF899 family)